MNWKKRLEENYTSIEDLKNVLLLSDEEVNEIRKIEERYPIAVPKYYLEITDKNNLADPIRKMSVPSLMEFSSGGSSDTSGEKDNTVVQGMQHKYRETALILSTNQCAMYCRHCFRRRFTGSMTGPASDEDIRKAAEYLAKHTEIREVLLTGGDLFNVIRENQTGAPYYLMTQFNHPDELTEEAMHAVEGFISLGIPAMNQTVLLKGVNDDAETLIKLCNDLLMHRIKPYYLFQGDLVKGTAHLRASIRKGLEIDRILRRELSGLALPQYTIDLPEGGGKVALTDNHIIAFENGIYAIETPDGDIRHYPESESEA